MTTHPILGQVAPVESLGRATLEAIEASGGCSISAELAGINARAMQDAEQRAVDRAVAAGLGASEWRACMVPETPQLPAFGQWLPIESAPKDGTCFIGYGQPTRGVPQGAYQTRWEAFGDGSPARVRFLSGEGPEGGFWYSESRWTNTWEPSHWMPLPPPPAKDSP